LLATGGCGACGAFGIGKTSGAALVMKPGGGRFMRVTRTGAQPFDPQMTATRVSAASARVNGATSGIPAAEVEKTAAGRTIAAAKATSRDFCMGFPFALKTDGAARAATLNKR
jgi:hypothetical protein